MFSAFLLLLTLEAVLCSTEADCDEYNNSLCYQGILSLEFPENEEELNNACGLAETSSECTLLYFEKCPLNKEERKRNVENIMRGLSTVCQRDSLLHAAISPNLKCIKAVHERPLICGMPDSVKASTIMNRYSAHLARNGISVALNETDLRTCMYIQYRRACEVAHVGIRCNEIAKDAVSEFYEHYMSSVSRCTLEFIHGLKTFVQFYEAALPENLDFRSHYKNV